MIPSERTLKKYCNNYTSIENYYEALTSPYKWIVHHKNGLYTDRITMLYEKTYYDLSAKDLVFLPAYKHSKLHKIFTQYSKYPGVKEICQRYEKKFKTYNEFVEFLNEWQESLKILYKK